MHVGTSLAKAAVAAATAASFLCASSSARGVVTPLGADRDNTIFEEDPVGTMSNGAGESIFVGVIDGGDLRRGLIHFDVAAALRPGSRVNSASLTLNLTRIPFNSTTPADIALHRTTANWGEGTSAATGGTGTMATNGDATWTHRFFNTADTWTTPGGDFAPAASATTSTLALGPYAWSGAAVTADVQSWLNAPANNFGWLLRDATEIGNRIARRFESRESTDPGIVPRLTIDWTIGGDANGDDRVNLNDFNVLAANFGQSPRTFEQGDFNGDTVVNLSDFNILAANFGFAAGGADAGVGPNEWGAINTFVPEPGAAAAALVCLPMSLRARRRVRQR